MGGCPVVIQAGFVSEINMRKTPMDILAVNENVLIYKSLRFVMKTHSQSPWFQQTLSLRVICVVQAKPSQTDDNDFSNIQLRYAFYPKI